MIFPVNYAMDGDAVAVRTDAGSGIDGSILRRVAFEVDHIDPEAHEGWSVVVRGVARDITDALDPPSAHTRALPLSPWAPGFKTTWIKILTRRQPGAGRPRQCQISVVTFGPVPGLLRRGSIRT